MDLPQAEAFLISQTKKREGGITEDLAKVFVKFWKLHKSRIHESLIEESTWNQRLKGLSWRVDVKSRTRTVDQLSVPCAIVELQLENRSSSVSVCVCWLNCCLHFIQDQLGWGGVFTFPRGGVNISLVSPLLYSCG